MDLSGELGRRGRVRSRQERAGVFHGKVEVFSEGVEEGEVGFCVVFVSECSAADINNVGVGGRVSEFDYRTNRADPTVPHSSWE